jgi:hypothetical protein
MNTTREQASQSQNPGVSLESLKKCGFGKSGWTPSRKVMQVAVDASSGMSEIELKSLSTSLKHAEFSALIKLQELLASACEPVKLALYPALTQGLIHQAVLATKNQSALLPEMAQAIFKTLWNTDNFKIAKACLIAAGSLRGQAAILSFLSESIADAVTSIDDDFKFRELSYLKQLKSFCLTMDDGRLAHLAKEEPLSTIESRSIKDHIIAGRDQSRHAVAKKDVSQEEFVELIQNISWPKGVYLGFEFLPGLEAIAVDCDGFKDAKIANHVALFELCRIQNRPIANQVWQSGLFKRFGFYWRVPVAQTNASNSPKVIAKDFYNSLMEHFSPLFKVWSSLISSEETIKSRLRVSRGGPMTRASIWEFAATCDEGSILVNDATSRDWNVEFLETKEVEKNKSCEVPPVNVALYCEAVQDHRFTFRKFDVEGSSDGTLAHALAVLAKRHFPNSQQVLDPFCGLATELLNHMALQHINELSQKIQYVAIDKNPDAIEKLKSHLGSDEVKSWLDTKNISDKQNLTVKHMDFREFKGVFDLIVTNPPFGMRTARGQSREVLEDLFIFAARQQQASRKSVGICMVSPAPSATRFWAHESGFDLKKHYPIKLGQMPCEIQIYSKS